MGVLGWTCLWNVYLADVYVSVIVSYSAVDVQVHKS